MRMDEVHSSNNHNDDNGCKGKKEGIMPIECEAFPHFQRNNYFFGKLMTVDDFQAEQKYLVNKHRLINRLIHGAGIVCGLNVNIIDSKSILIEQGVALDCCGREIIVPEDTKFDISELVEREKGKENSDAFVWVKYDYYGASPVPRTQDISNGVDEFNFSRVVEIYCIGISSENPDSEKIDNGYPCNQQKNSCKIVLAKVVMEQKDNEVSIIKVDNIGNRVCRQICRDHKREDSAQKHIYGSEFFTVISIPLLLFTALIDWNIYSWIILLVATLLFTGWFLRK
jgi:hypothetical protein